MRIQPTARASESVSNTCSLVCCELSKTDTRLATNLRCVEARSSFPPLSTDSHLDLLEEYFAATATIIVLRFSACQRALRASDLIARHGSESFLVPQANKRPRRVDARLSFHVSQANAFTESMPVSGSSKCYSLTIPQLAGHGEYCCAAQRDPVLAPSQDGICLQRPALLRVVIVGLSAARGNRIL